MSINYPKRPLGIGSHQTLYRVILQGHPDALFLINENGQILDVNQNASLLLQRSRKELDQIKWNEVLHPAQFVSTMRNFMQALKGEPQRFVTAIVNDGEMRDVEVTFTPASAPEIGGRVLVTVRDVTTEKKLAQDLHDSREALKNSEKLAALAELAAGIAHEIRNPLTTLKGFIQLLHQYPQQDYQEYKHIMLSELSRIETIVSELVTLAKPQVHNMEALDLRIALHLALEALRDQAKLQHVEVTLDLPRENLLIHGNDQQLRIVFTNVLQNALEALPNGGHITITATRSDERADIRFADNGLGISEDRLSQIGEPFYTTKDRGTGLGLMISRRILDFHQGSLSIDSQLGKGTTVEIGIPLS